MMSSKSIVVYRDEQSWGDTRSPESAGRRIFVQGYPSSAKAKDFERFFHEIRDIDGIRITPRFAFITFRHPKDFSLALSKNGESFLNKTIAIRPYRDEKLKPKKKIKEEDSILEPARFHARARSRTRSKSPSAFDRSRSTSSSRSGGRSRNGDRSKHKEKSKTRDSSRTRDKSKTRDSSRTRDRSRTRNKSKTRGRSSSTSPSKRLAVSTRHNRDTHNGDDAVKSITSSSNTQPDNNSLQESHKGPLVELDAERELRTSDAYRAQGLSFSAYHQHSFITNGVSNIPNDVDLTLKLVIEQKTARNLSLAQIDNILNYFQSEKYAIKSNLHMPQVGPTYVPQPPQHALVTQHMVVHPSQMHHQQPPQPAQQQIHQPTYEIPQHQARQMPPQQPVEHSTKASSNQDEPSLNGNQARNDMNPPQADYSESPARTPQLDDMMNAIAMAFLRKENSLRK